MVVRTLFCQASRKGSRKCEFTYFYIRTYSTVCKSITRFSRIGVDRMYQPDVFDAALATPENPMKRYQHHHPLGRYNARGHSRTGRAHFPYTVTVIPTIRIAGMKEKDMVGQKGPFFPHTVKGQNRCSTRVLAASDGILRGFYPASALFWPWHSTWGCSGSYRRRKIAVYAVTAWQRRQTVRFLVIPEWFFHPVQSCSSRR